MRSLNMNLKKLKPVLRLNNLQTRNTSGLAHTILITRVQLEIKKKLVRYMLLKYICNKNSK